MKVNDSSYDTIPVSAFGAAMLRGMGWTGSFRRHCIGPYFISAEWREVVGRRVENFDMKDLEGIAVPYHFRQTLAHKIIV